MISNEHNAAKAWYVADHDANDKIVRGPYETSEAAAAVRREMERDAYWAERNLWIMEADRGE